MIKNNRSITEDPGFWKNPPKTEEKTTAPASKISSLYQSEVTTSNGVFQEIYMKVKP